MKVRLRPYYKGEVKGIDIEIINKNATVADYLEALDAHILTAEFDRLRKNTGQCQGCDICCRERMPLTSIDMYTLHEKIAPELTKGEFFNRYTYVAVSERAVDIMLVRNYADECIFLDKEKKRCTQYEARPLVCRTYICTCLSPRANKLREEIVNAGEDELVRQWLGCFENQESIIHEADNPCIIKDDWPKSAWSGKKKYYEVSLQDILSPGLWNNLLKKGEDVV